MKTIKFLKRIALIALAFVLLVPVHLEMDDGGSEIWSAVLWGVEKRHSLWTQDGIRGYRSGTVARVLWIEIYDDVKFVPGTM